MSFKEQWENIEWDDALIHFGVGTFSVVFTLMFFGAWAATLILLLNFVFWPGRELMQSGSWNAWKRWSLKKWIEAFIGPVGGLIALLILA